MFKCDAQYVAALTVMMMSQWITACGEAPSDVHPMSAADALPYDENAAFAWDDDGPVEDDDDDESGGGDDEGGNEDPDDDASGECPDSGGGSGGRDRATRRLCRQERRACRIDCVGDLRVCFRDLRSGHGTSPRACLRAAKTCVRDCRAAFLDCLERDDTSDGETPPTDGSSDGEAPPT